MKCANQSAIQTMIGDHKKSMVKSETWFFLQAHNTVGGHMTQNLSISFAPLLVWWHSLIPCWLCYHSETSLTDNKQDQASDFKRNELKLHNSHCRSCTGSLHLHMPSLKMEAENSFETLVSIYQTLSNPMRLHVKSPSTENLKSKFNVGRSKWLTPMKKNIASWEGNITNTGFCNKEGYLLTVSGI